MISMTPFVLLALQAQDPPQPVFRVATEAVQVDVWVGRDGRAVLGLEPDDFELRDNGVRQDIELLDIETTPIHLAVVVDASDSMAGARLRHLKDGAHSLLERMDTKDRATLVSFSHVLERRAPLTGELDRLHRAVDELEAYGATAWRDALYAGLKLVEDVPHRPMVLLFSDGWDTYSWLREEQMPSLVRRSHAVIYAVTRSEPAESPDLSLTSGRRRRRWRRAREEHAARVGLMRELAEASGGRLIETASTERLREVFLEIVAEMKTRYLLTYRPPPPIRKGWHEIEVDVRARGVEVRSRRGYFYEAPERP